MTYDKLIVEEDEIYTFNPETEKGEWSLLLGLAIKEYDGDLVSIENHRISALVTPNHRWLVGSTTEPWEGGKKYKFITTAEFNTRHYIPNGALLENEEVYYADAFVQVMGWIVTEGHYGRDTRKREESQQFITINQSFRKNEQKCQQIEQNLRDAGIPFRTYRNEEQGMLLFSLDRTVARRIIAQFPNKLLTYDFLGRLTGEQVKLLYRTMMNGDGYISQTQHETYCSADTQLLDEFQAVAVLAGQTTNRYLSHTTPIHVNERYGDVHVVSMRRERMVKLRGLLEREGITQVPYQGKIWCPNTITGTWIARRNGKTYITGNSLQNAAQVPIRLNSRRAEGFLSRFGQLVLSRVLQYYPDDRIVWLTKDAKAMVALQQRAQFIQNIIQSGSEEEMERLLQMTARDFQFRVENESGLGIAKTQKLAFAERQQAAGNLSGVEVLKAAGMSNPEEKIQEAEMARQKQAAGVMGLKMLMAGMGGEQSGGGIPGRRPPKGGGRSASQQQQIEQVRRNGAGAA